jgi:6-phosphogluconolactonase
MGNDKTGNGTGAVYFMTNATDGKNEVIMHQRMMDGRLGMAMAYATGGSGAGMGPMAPFADPLGSQSAIVMSDKHHMLFVVNAGSDDISAFRVQEGGLMLMDKVASGGNFPVSLTVHGDWLYVLNAGGDGTVMGYAIQQDGKLVPMNGSMRSLKYGGKTPPYVFEAPGQIDFSPDRLQTTRCVSSQHGW